MEENTQVRMDIFNTLQEINCNQHVEKKNGLNYLSWAWAWGIAKSIYPRSYYTVYENENGWNYFNDGKTCWVKTGVTMVNGDYSLEHIEYLPVMDFKNKSIALEDVTSFDVNKAIQRSLTKALARHGLGLYIYASEDLPMESEAQKQEREEKERQEAEFLSSTIAKIDTAVQKTTKNMNKDDKVRFANETIVPVVGCVNYKTCKDITKLTKLLELLEPAA